MTARRAYLELFLQALIFYSVGMYFIEVEYTRTNRSLGVFLWSERIVAIIFTVEYLVRWRSSKSAWYPARPIAIVDLVSVLPFWLGFFVDLQFLRVVRAMRVLRVFKLFRNSAAFRNLVNAFNRIRYEFSIVGFAVFVIVWLGAVAIFELEHDHQPEAFGQLTDALWFVLATITTVGYGDKVPATSGGRLVAAGVMISGLVLFGTFVSLIGSAFLEEIRNARRRVPEIYQHLTRMTAADFDHRQVLEAIEGGAFQGGEVSRLLAEACRHKIAAENYTVT